MTEMPDKHVTDNDALLIVDVQNDFLPGGSLAVKDGDQVIPPLNGYIEHFRKRGLATYATRDWHPPNHCSFQDQGGIWPSHCVVTTRGAEFAPTLKLPKDCHVVSKATDPSRDAYSGFEGTDLAQRLRTDQVRRLFVGGLATDYCVLNTVEDALREGFAVILLEDAIRAVDVNPGDGQRAREQMHAAGAVSGRLPELAA